jgi:hypothetical protein
MRGEVVLRTRTIAVLGAVALALCVQPAVAASPNHESPGTPGAPNCEGQTRAYLAQTTRLNGQEAQEAARALCGRVVQLVSIDVRPANSTLPAGRTQQFTATGTYSDGTNRDLTGSVTWSSSNRSAATISNASGSPGLATGVAPGITTIRATQDGVAGTTTLAVT